MYIHMYTININWKIFQANSTDDSQDRQTESPTHQRIDINVYKHL